MSNTGYSRELQYFTGGRTYIMRVTDVRLRVLNNEGKTRAVASVTFDDELVIHDVRLVEGRGGLFLSMPSRKRAQGGYRDIAHPVTAEARGLIQEAVMRAYEENVNGCR